MSEIIEYDVVMVCLGNSLNRVASQQFESAKVQDIFLRLWQDKDKSLVQKVNEKIRDGWQPLGSPLIAKVKEGDLIFQAIVKHNPS